MLPRCLVTQAFRHSVCVSLHIIYHPETLPLEGGVFFRAAKAFL